MEVINKEKLKHQETRKRFYFIFKLLLLVFLLFFQNDVIEFIKLRFTDDTAFLNAFFIYLTGHLIIAFSRLILVNFYIRKHKLKENVKNNFIIGINRIAEVLSAIILLLAIFTLFDIDLVKFFTGISVVAAAIAILSKDYFSNMINGFIIMFSDQLSVNDYVKIGEHKGKIVDITFLNIHLVNEDEDLIYIPNSTIFTNDIVNFSKQAVKKVTIDFEIKPDQIFLLQQLENQLIEALSDWELYIKKGSYITKVGKITKDVIQVKFQFILKKENREIEKQIRRLLPRKIVENINSVQNQNISSRP